VKISAIFSAYNENFLPNIFSDMRELSAAAQKAGFVAFPARAKMRCQMNDNAFIRERTRF
jgi:hypothetical protein